MKNPYAKYLESHAGDRDPLVVAAATPGKLYAMLAPLIGANDERLSQRPMPGKWSIREVVAHLADCEIGFGFRLRQGMAAPEVAMQPWDQEVWAERYEVYDTASALSTFITLRNWNMLFLKTIEPTEWAVVVSHPERGAGTFRVLVETMAGHDLNHLEQIERLLR
jgi:DinB superfamily